MKTKIKTKPRKKERRALRQPARSQPLPQLLAENGNRILSFKEWCALNGFAPRTGRRIIAGEYGTPPVVTRLSPRRIGISLANNAAWQASRERAAS